MKDIEFLDFYQNILLVFENLSEYRKNQHFQSNNQYFKIFENSFLNRVLFIKICFRKKIWFID